MRILLKNIEYLATFGNTGELSHAYILVENGVIKDVGKYTAEVEGQFNVDEVVDMSGRLVLPGFVNTHHHFFQTLTRNVKKVQDAKLFDWLVYLYEIWKWLDEESIRSATKIAIYEMMKSGVTTTSDMFYPSMKESSRLFDVEIESAMETGMRLHIARGGMSIGKKDGSLPPDEMIQTDDGILEEYQRVVERYHDSSRYSMLRIALAPCTPFLVTPGLMRETLELAEKNNVLLHTHLAETLDEEKFCIERFGKRPVEYMESLGWLNPRVWFAHVVWVTDEEITKLQQGQVGIAHCPVSNMRLGSGIAPIHKMKGKLRIGLAVDGSASNDTNNMLQEMRIAMLLQRVEYGANAISPREVVHMATVGGARVLHMDDYIGKIEKGYAADIVAFRLDSVEMAGCLDDPLSAIVMCDAKEADFLMINGVVKIKDGELIGIDMAELARKHNVLSKRLLSRKVDAH